MDNNGGLDGNASRLPVEVCENVIDMLYSVAMLDQLEHSRTLHSCALVCRAWRTRSQRNLFYSVVLHSTEAVRRLAAALDNGPHLCDFVREVILMGHTHDTTVNPLSLFPIVLHGKLPKLREFSVTYVPDDMGWYPMTSEFETAKPPEGTTGTTPLEHLSLHPRFPLLLSGFTTVTRLFIFHATFGHLNNLLGMLNSLPALQRVGLQGVRFANLGPLPMYTKQRADVDYLPPRPFAPNLRELGLVRLLQRML